MAEFFYRFLPFLVFPILIQFFLLVLVDHFDINFDAYPHPTFDILQTNLIMENSNFFLTNLSWYQSIDKRLPNWLSLWYHIKCAIYLQISINENIWRKNFISEKKISKNSSHTMTMGYFWTIKREKETILASTINLICKYEKNKTNENFAIENDLNVSFQHITILSTKT